MSDICEKRFTQCLLLLPILNSPHEYGFRSFRFQHKSSNGSQFCSRSCHHSKRTSSTTESNYRGGSQPGRAKNRNSNMRAKFYQLDRDLYYRYHCIAALSTEIEFEQTNRISRCMYKKLRNDILERDKFLNASQTQVESLG